MNIYRSCTCNDLRVSNAGEQVRLSGWVFSKRDHGNLLFIDLRDHYGRTQCVVDTENKYNLALGERKQTRQGRNGYKINVYQIWSEPGKEDVKSLVTVSVYNPVSEQIYVSAETKAQMDAAPTAAPTQ